MSLSVPDSDDLRIFMRRSSTDPFSTDEEEWAEESLQAAADLLELATGVHEDPTDDLELRIVQRGILAMGFALLVRGDDMEALFSPFSSERIGNYSYSKAQNAVLAKETTGVSAFDTAVAMLLAKVGDTDGVLTNFSTERVFQPGYEAQLEATDPLYHDPNAAGVWSSP